MPGMRRKIILLFGFTYPRILLNTMLGNHAVPKITMYHLRRAKPVPNAHFFYSTSDSMDCYSGKL